MAPRGSLLATLIGRPTTEAGAYWAYALAALTLLSSADPVTRHGIVLLLPIVSLAVLTGCASDESMAAAALRSYSRETTSGSIDRAFALMERQAQRICPRDMLGATIEFERSSPIRRISPVRIKAIEASDEYADAIPDGIVLDVTIEVSSTDRGLVELHRFVGAVKEDGRWKLAATRRCLGVFP